MRRAPALYRWLLRLHPRVFRREFGAEMEDTFVAHLAAARRRGAGAVAAVWVRGLRDLVVGALRERRSDGAGPSATRRRRGGGMGDWIMDLRYAARALRRRPALTVAAVVTLTLGIGATTAIFTLVNGMLFRPFGYDDEARLVQIWAQNPERGWTDVDVTLPDAWAWRQRTDAFADVAAYTYVGITDQSGDVPVRLDGVWHTPNLLPLLGVEPVLGRGLGEADAAEGAPAAVVVSHGYWERVLGADRDAVGTEVVLNGLPRTVVGVLPPDFRFLAMDADIFVPWQGDPHGASLDEHSWNAVGRLAAGATVASADGAVRAVSAAMAAEHPDSHEGFTASVITLRREMLGEIAERAAGVLLAAVGFVLLMACANVANLLLSRASERSGEMAVRAALGAGRGRLVRQLMAEALLLATVGGVGGAVVAVFGSRAMVAGLPSTLPAVFSFDLDVRVLAFSVGVVLLAALVFGLVPALRIARPAAELRGSGRGGLPRGRAAGGLVVLQTALAVVLLVGGVVMARGVVSLRTQEMGWDARGVLSARLSPRSADYPTGEEVEDFHTRVLDAVATVPGITAVGATQSMPLQGSNSVGSIRLAERDAGTEEVAVRITRLTPGYLDALDLHVLQGRDVTRADRAGAERVVLVNETFVARYLGGASPLDRTFVWDDDEAPLRIVGVVEDHIERAVDRPMEPSIYVPMAQMPAWTRTLVVRTTGDPSALAAPLRAAVAGVDPTVAVFDVLTMRERIADRLGGFDLLAGLMGAFALLSLVLGSVGIYGVTARAVARRTREIGLRLALGAEPSAVQRAIAGDALRAVAVGLAVGLALAVPLAGALRAMAAGIDTRSPVSFLPAVAVLLLVGGVGAWLPARRASRIDPVRTLSSE